MHPRDHGPAFIGRERELETLHQALQAALLGRGQLVLLVGEPGIGKTRLAEELTGTARARGARVLWGRCWDGGGAPAYWPWVQVIRSCVREIDPQILASCTSGDLTEIARLVPEVARALSGRPDAAVASEHARFRLFDSTTMLLKRVAAAQPLVVVLDDLHSADEPSLQLLRFLARELHAARALVIGTYRDTEVRQASHLSRIFAAVARDSQRLHLRGLNHAEIAALIAALMRDPAADELVTRVQSITDGNPFFVDGIARLLPAAGDDRSLPIPDEVREAIRRRLEPLGADTATVLAAAAIAGREFDERVVGRVMESRSGVSVLAILRRAAEAGLIDEIGGALGRYRFRHALIADTLYHDLTPDQRARLHADTGEVLERLYTDNADTHEAELAHQFLLAGDCIEARRAVEWAVRAGRRAAKLLGYEDAASWFERALQQCTQRGGTAAEQCEILLHLGDAERRAGELRKAAAAFERAANLARVVTDAEMFGRAVVGLGISLEETGTLNQSRVSLIEEALQRLPATDSPLRAALLGRLAVALYFSPSDERRQHASQQALEMARRLGDQATLGGALLTRHFALWSPGHAAERLEIASEAVRLGERSGSLDTLLSGLWWQVTDLIELGDISAACVTLDVYKRLSTERRLARDQWYAALSEAAVALLRGRYTEAEELSARAYELGARSEAENAPQFLGVQTFLRYREQGRLRELEASVRVFAGRFPALPVWQCALAFLYSEVGELDGARSVLDTVAAHDFRDLPFDGNWLAALCLLVETCVAVGDPDRARLLYDLLKAHADSNVVIAMGIGSLGPASYYAARAAAACGEDAQAEALLRRAIHRNETMAAAPWLAYAQHALAQLRGSDGQPLVGSREAAELRRRALAGARSMAMSTLLARIEASPVIAAPPAATGRSKGAPGATPRFEREGAFWRVMFEDRHIRLQDTKGVRYIAQLVEQPGRAIPAVQLQGNDEPAGSSADETVRHQDRYLEICEEIAEAERFNDVGRAERARAQLEALAREIETQGPAIKLAGADAERARLNVTRAIAASVRRIARLDAALAAHLTNHLKTGNACRYTGGAATIGARRSAVTRVS